MSRAADRWDEDTHTHDVVHCRCEQCWRLKVVSLLRDIKDILEHMIEVKDA